MWLQQTTPMQRRALLAAFAGYGVDGFDLMIYTFLIPTLLTVWGMTKAQAGYIATGALITSAIGGWLAGVLADRYGRVRVLQLTVLWFAFFTFLSGFTGSFWQLLVTRSMQGFGFGGEWAVGSVLVAETIAPRHRGKAAGLVQSSWSFGWAGAALAFWIVAALLPAAFAWRVAFWIGILPALLVVYIRRKVDEPALAVAARRRAAARPSSAQMLDIFRAPVRTTTLRASLLSTGMLAAYYSVTTWLPTFLKSERHLSVTDTTGYLLVLILGSFVGYLTNAWLSDWIGRRRAIMLFAAGGAPLVLLYTRLALGERQMLALGFLLGFFLLGIFAAMGAFLAELFPSAVRCAGQGFCYSVGRAIGAVCPALIGVWSSRISLGQSIGAMTAAAFALVIIAAWTLPETRGRVLSVEAGVAA